MSHAFCPDLLYLDGRFGADKVLVVDASGRIERIAPKHESTPGQVTSLPGKAMLPGFVNAHSHSFQRLIRGMSESRTASGSDFWSWRGTMYHAAARLTPEQLYDVARMAFLEMLFTGTTTVGEFHYLHTDPSGQPYDDPNLLSKQVIAAARSVGLRIVLLRSAYLRSGYGMARDPGQTRFFESTSKFLHNSEQLLAAYRTIPEEVGFGIAPHSLRAVPLGDLLLIADWTRARGLPLHMHVSEQIAENQACAFEYGCTPVELLSRHGLLGEDFTAVHAIHVTPEEVAALAREHCVVCSCPTTERNLGDGIFAADAAMLAGVRVALGSDSQTQIDPLEDARELEYHLRLRDQRRAILDLSGDQGMHDQEIAGEGIAQHLFACATRNGARSLSVHAGEFAPGALADAFTLDTGDLSLAGCSAGTLLPCLVFSSSIKAVRDVMVNGQWTIRNGEHPLQTEIVARYSAVHKSVWPHT